MVTVSSVLATRPDLVYALRGRGPRLELKTAPAEPAGANARA
jgi:hypothetical protein